MAIVSLLFSNPIMAKVFALPRKGPVVFKTRNPLAAPRWVWLQWVCWFIFMVTIIETYANLAAHPEISLLRWLSSSSTHAVLRPGQYREATTYQFLPDGLDGEEGDADDMGYRHDLRFVNTLTRSQSHLQCPQLMLIDNYRNEQFYLGGTLTLTSTHSADPNSPHPVPSIYDPYPAYNSRKWRKKYHGTFRPCLGPRGRDLDRSRPEDMVMVYKGKQIGFPAMSFGSFEAMGLDGDVCTDRYSRFGAYGYDEENDDNIPGFTRPEPVNWFDVDWYKLQNMCFERNANRYLPSALMNESRQRPLSFELREPPKKGYNADFRLDGLKKQRHHARSAVLIRSWSNMVWTPHHREYLRALIMELSLHSGAEYEIFLLVHVKDDELPIFSDRKTMDDLRRSIPAEFRNMALFFNNKLLEAWYPKIEEHR